MRVWLRRNWAGVLIVGIIVFLICVVFATQSSHGPYTYDDHPEHWDKAYRVGSSLPVGGDRYDAEVFVAWRYDAYGENWRPSIFTCSYGQFVERVA